MHLKICSNNVLMGCTVFLIFWSKNYQICGEGHDYLTGEEISQLGNSGFVHGFMSIL